MKICTLVEESKMPLYLPLDRAYKLFTDKLKSKSSTVAEKKMREGKTICNVKEELIEKMSTYLKTALSKTKWGRSSEGRAK